ncbi:lipoprotein-releasing ABC transporter permease subunit LolE [Aliagarivorans taiwanensis]|uniref:lipoprotein-releasing ABC transporter permease subunit LolE n=1 Tax=Aliagarivorans taiwanensis TaxID=561966 RepID=UPI0004035C3C|nr:lipoprotein-releasing ABC transporter permease subunit LolE [Aliagarivorans taiwanensis]
MSLPLSTLIGLRYHRARHRNGFISFISASSTIGILLGVAVLIIGLSVMNGFERELQQRFLAIISHGELEAVEQPLADGAGLLEIATSQQGVEAAAPYISLSGLLQKGKQMKAIAVKGIDPDAERQISRLPEFVSSEAWQALEPTQANIIIGAGIADELGLAAGDTATLLLPQQSTGQRLSSPQRVAVRVVGLMRAAGQLDNQLGFVHIDQARQLNQWESGVSGISLRVSNPLQADELVRTIGMHSEQLVYVRSWMRTHGFLYQDIQLVRTIMYAIMLLIVAVASFNIVSTLILAVTEKRSDIAILKTMGAEDGLLIRAFVVYGAYNGVLGCLLGVVLGLLGVWSLPSLVAGVEQLLGRTILSADIYFIDFLPVELLWSDVALVALAALSLSLLATLWPAWQATRIRPAQELGG